MSSVTDSPVFRQLGLCDYQTTWAAMQEFTDRRDQQTTDEIWLLEHPPVFTVGLNGGMQHVLDPGDIPVIRIDRGGQVTYHGPGQLVIYPLIDLRRRKMGVRDLVSGLEQAVVETLATYKIDASSRPDAPGVYVDGRKIASLGLRIRRGCSYHGLAFNIDMDLAPFTRINPCGFEDLPVTTLSDLGGPGDLLEVAKTIRQALMRVFDLKIAPKSK